jgi:hypothetical protein
VVRCLQRASGGIEYLRYLFVFHILEVAHIEYQTLFLGKAVDGLVKKGNLVNRFFANKKTGMLRVARPF